MDAVRQAAGGWRSIRSLREEVTSEDVLRSAAGWGRLETSLDRGPGGATGFPEREDGNLGQCAPLRFAEGFLCKAVHRKTAGTQNSQTGRKTHQKPLRGSVRREVRQLSSSPAGRSGEPEQGWNLRSDLRCAASALEGEATTGSALRTPGDRGSDRTRCHPQAGLRASVLSRSEYRLFTRPFEIAGANPRNDRRVRESPPADPAGGCRFDLCERAFRQAFRRGDGCGYCPDGGHGPIRAREPAIRLRSPSFRCAIVRIRRSCI